jgi:hypothetical protein
VLREKKKTFKKRHKDLEAFKKKRGESQLDQISEAKGAESWGSSRWTGT